MEKEEESAAEKVRSAAERLRQRSYGAAVESVKREY
jgi:hypothetical protein